VKVVVCVEPAAIGAAARAALVLAARLAGREANPATDSGLAAPEAEVAALSAAPVPGGKGLLDACRRGASRGVELVGPGLDGSDADALGRALAEAARGLGADVVLAGNRSDREGRGIVGAAVAHHLGAPYLANIESLSFETPGEVVVTLRAGGLRRRLAVPLPVVLTVAPSVLPPDPVPPATGPPAIEVIRVEVPGPRPPPTLYGALDRPRHKAETVTSAVELVRRWRSG
jgi:electron transfer flavoprotein alpha/beta subunit